MASETWRYEASTQTIRSVPQNYWIASMNSWDRAINHEENALLIAKAPTMRDAPGAIASMVIDETTDHTQLSALCIAIAKAALEAPMATRISTYAP